MFGNTIHRAQKLRYGWSCRGILRTAPLRVRPAPVTIVSMVRNDDWLMYLVSIKALYRSLPGGDIVVIDDGTLTARQRETLRSHIDGVEIVDIATIDTGPCPRGGCWERLLHILDRSRDRYVIQIDSDVLAMGPCREVAEAVAANRAFTLNGGANQPIRTLEEAAAAVADQDPRHMQFLAEQLLPRIPATMGRLYVRGSAGFAGFARGGPGRDVAEAFSRAMQSMLGARWAEWGSEQITSNYIVCNSPGGIALPWPDYACFYPDIDPDTAHLLHFIGTWRFDRGVYLRRSRQAIDELLRAPGRPAATPIATPETSA